MCIVQVITNTGDVSFYELVVLISSQAALVDSHTPKKDTPRKIKAAQTNGGRGRGGGGGRGSGFGGG
jgi:hypothetical protein